MDSYNYRLDDICDKLEDSITHFPEIAKEPNQDKYYSSPLYLTRRDSIVLLDCINRFKRTRFRVDIDD